MGSRQGRCCSGPGSAASPGWTRGQRRRNRRRKKAQPQRPRWLARGEIGVPLPVQVESSLSHRLGHGVAGRSEGATIGWMAKGTSSMLVRLGNRDNGWAPSVYPCPFTFPWTDGGFSALHPWDSEQLHGHRPHQPGNGIQRMGTPGLPRIWSSRYLGLSLA